MINEADLRGGEHRDPTGTVETLISCDAKLLGMDPIMGLLSVLTKPFELIIKSVEAPNIDSIQFVRFSEGMTSELFKP